jgi:hypothetical protein
VAANKASSPLTRIEGEHHEAGTQRHMTAAQVIALNPTAFKELLNAVSPSSGISSIPRPMELTILRSELGLLRAENKSSLEVKAAFIMRELSV